MNFNRRPLFRDTRFKKNDKIKTIVQITGVNANSVQNDSLPKSEERPTLALTGRHFE